MFQKKYLIKTLLLNYLIAFIAMGNFTLAQNPAPAQRKSSDPHTQIIQQCVTLMEQSKWQETLELLNLLIEQNKDTGLKKHGAKFATAYYYQGLCLLKLAQAQNKLVDNKSQQDTDKLFLSAIESFNQCYVINPPEDKSNIYRAKSLLLRGNAEQSLGKFQSAIDSYKLFLHERNNALDPYSLSDFNINLAICLWKKSTPENAIPEDTAKDTEQAIELLQESILYSGRNQPSPRAVLTALSTLTDIAIHKADQTPDLITSTLLRTRNISPGNLILSADTATEEFDNLLPTLGKLILITAQKNLPLASLHLSTLIPGISRYSVELEIPAELELPPLAENFTPNKSIQETTAIALQARALTHQNSNNLPAAIQLYTILVEKYSDTPHQPENLYNLARLTAKTEDSATAIKLCRQFLNDHPQHSLKSPTLTILLNTLYHSKQYQESLTLAEQILNETEASPILTPFLKDTACFIRAASHYYLGNFTAASPLLAEHQKTYPESHYQTDASYLNAAVQNQLLDWEKSIPLLRKFISDHNENSPTEPASIYLPFAHYDIAFAQYSQRHLHSAILTLLPFTLDIPFVTQPIETSQISPSAAMLLGNIHLLLRQRDTAVSHYENAIQIATDIANTDARDEAYYLLIDLLGKDLWDGLTNHRLKETIPFYLHFLTLENAKNSPYHTQILTSAITALEKANPHNPELPAQLLSKNLFLDNNKPNTPGIETALKTYLYYLRKNEIPAEEIIRILTEDVKTSNSAYHQALLITAQIETLQHSQNREQNPDTQAQINRLYQELISQFRTQDLDNFTLLNIAQHLTKNNDQTQAASYYQAIIDSKANISKPEARLGLAIQLASSKNLTPEQKQSARMQLTSILENPFTPPATLATAHYHIIQLLLKDENWPEVETNSIAYLKYPLDVKTHHLEILQLLALAYDKQGPANPAKIDSAISTYAHIYATALFSIEHSAPAIDRTCQLLWERNNPAAAGIQNGKSDRQLAYETAYKYIRQTKNHLAQRKDSIPETAIQTWNNIQSNATKTYLSDPTIKPFQGQP